MIKTRKIRRCIFLYAICLCYISSLFAQDTNFTDSLSLLISKSKNDTGKVNLLNELAAHYLFTNTTGAKEPAEKALKLAEKLSYDKGCMDAMNRLGIMYFRMANYDSSLVFYRKGLTLAEKTQDTLYLTKFRGNVALSLSWLGKYEESLEMYINLLDLQKIYNPLGQAHTLLDMAGIYYKLKDYGQAYENALEARVIAEKFNDPITLGNAYNSMGAFLEGLNRKSEALDCYRQSYQLKIQTGDKLGQANTLINVASINSEEGKPEKALVIYDTVIQLCIDIGAMQQLANAYTNKGVSYTALGDYKKANSSFSMAYDIYKNAGSLDLMILLAGKLGANYERTGDYKNASLYFREQAIMKDSLFRVEMAENIAEMRTKYETEKNEEENLRLEKENELQQMKLDMEHKKKQNLIFLFSGVAIFVILLFLIIIIRYRLKKKAEMEKKLAREQNIRFRAVIEAEEKERIRIARELHDGIGQLLSSARVNMAALDGGLAKEDEPVLKNSLEIIDEAVTEVRNISHNMMPVALIEYGLVRAVESLVARINEANKLKVAFEKDNIPEKFDQSIEITLYRVIQEVLNNMVRHSEAANIDIHLKREGDIVKLSMQDNGKGFIVENIGNSPGIGWKNIYSRISMINGNIDILSNPDSGTKINIDFAV
ncbi:MAG: sensor histidine kinase [Bacteroidota bacterium]